MKIRNICRWVILGIGMLVFSLAGAEIQQPVSPIGNWMIIDSGTKEPRATLNLWVDNNVLYGKVTKVFRQQDNKTACEDCPEDFQGKPIVGMEVLWGLVQQSDYTWTNGKALDPRKGKVYSCSITLSPDGQLLMVHGYLDILGTPELAREQTWYRI